VPINQLRGDANSISRAKDRSLDYGIYTTELAGDFRQRQLRALVSFDRSMGDDAEALLI